MRIILNRSWFVLVAALFGAALMSGVAGAQSVKLSVRSNEIYEDVPFVLQVSASGFEESPQPEVSDFSIRGAKVTYQGMSPSVRSMRSVINGRVTSSRVVRFVYSYRVEPQRSGQFEIPSIFVTQGRVSASCRPGRFEARAIASTTDMRIYLDVPQRAVWIGEQFDVGIAWYLRKDPKNPNFVIPLFDHPAFEIEAADASSSERLAFSAGGQTLALPYVTEKVSEEGIEYTRFTFRAVATPTQAGVFTLDAPRVMSKLQVGVGRDGFGFAAPRYRLAKATGETQKFEVKALPLSGRPASFSNAVGTGFSISLATSRSVVSVGEPVALTVVIRGAHGLAGLSLPALLGEGRLDPARFDILGDAATGIMADDGLSKTFTVTTVIKSAKVSAIPAVEFSYFDPEKGRYETVRSQPIALNVDGANTVGAQDVVGTSRKNKRNPKSRHGSGSAFGGDLTPSTGAKTLRSVASLSSMLPLLAGLYLLPLLMLTIMLWLKRTGESRGRSSEVRRALALLQTAAREAKTQAARTSTGPLMSCVKELAKRTGHAPDSSWLAQMESLAFDPERQSKPLPPELVEAALEEAKRWSKAPASNRTSATLVALVILCLGTLLSSEASAAEGTTTDATDATDATEVTSVAARLDKARASYAAALETGERSARVRNFAATELLYRKLAENNSNRPELLSDWGNAALGAGELGRAALAYKRALLLDRGLLRAQKNLNWIRQQMPGHLVVETDTSAVDSLFFWHKSWPLLTRHLVAALAFALACFMVMPWGMRIGGLLRRLALFPFLLFLATLGSALLEPGIGQSAVIVGDGQTLRTADSLGAPPAMASPLPAGLEVSLEERRGSWAQVILADGMTGWLSTSAVELVQPN